MKKKLPTIFLVLGILLILASVAMLLFYQLRMENGAAESQKTAEKLENLLPERHPGVPGLDPDPRMPVLQLEGVDYVALLEVPAFGLTLPVAEAWDANALFDAPARFAGSTYDHSLVIGGSDHQAQFGFCDKIDIGAAVAVTDMTGARFTYTVARVDRADSAEAQWLTEEGWDLTLFCHDVYSMEYLAVRCTFSYQ